MFPAVMTRILRDLMIWRLRGIVAVLILLNGSGRGVASVSSLHPEKHPFPQYNRSCNIRTSTAAPTERCYGVYGCFSVAGAWTSPMRPVSNFPEAPEDVGPTYCLFTGQNASLCQNLGLGDRYSLARLNASHRVFFITHGYLEDGKQRWIQKMVGEALAHGGLSVIVIDWSSGSMPPYSQAAANIRLIGVMVAHFLLFLHEELRINPANCHIVGHSLGAHLAGYTGQHLQRCGHELGRITGLDPADPYFQNTEAMIRLDSSDAQFVDVIHTNGGPFLSLGFGLLQPSGHVDFYPNGGIQQPGCVDNVFESIRKEQGNLLYGLKDFLGCSHLRSYEFFSESINSPCPFTAVQCPTWQQFRSGRCQCDAVHRCYSMGYKAQRHPLPVPSGVANDDTSVLTYLVTGSESPFCRYHYRVTLVVSDSADSVRQGGDRGSLTIQLHGDIQSSPMSQLNDEVISFEPGKAYSFVVGSPPLGRLRSATVSWIYWSSVFNPLTWRIISIPALHVNRIIIFNVETDKTTEICGNDVAIQSGKEVRMLPQADCRPQTNWTNSGDDVGRSNNFLERFGRRKKNPRKKKSGNRSSRWH